MSNYVRQTFTAEQQLVRTQALQEVLEAMTASEVLEDGFNIQQTTDSMILTATIRAEITTDQAYRIIKGAEHV